MKPQTNKAGLHYLLALCGLDISAAENRPESRKENRFQSGFPPTSR
jgi:hypothetical protein